MAKIAGSALSLKPPRILIHVQNPTAFSGQGSIIVLEWADEPAALKVARKIADETGRCVTVYEADMTRRRFPLAEVYCRQINGCRHCGYGYVHF